MAWLTLTELQYRLPAEILTMLTDDDEDDSPDTATYTAGINSATEYVQGYIGRRYAADAAAQTASAAITDLCAAVAAYLLCRRLHSVPMAVETAYNKAKDVLEEIRDGRFDVYGFTPTAVLSTPKFYIEPESDIQRIELTDTSPTSQHDGDSL